MTAKIKFTADDAEVQKSLEEQRKKNEKLEKSYVDVNKQVVKNERAQINAAKRIIKGQRDEKQILNDKIKALRTLGQTDASQKQAANSAIRKLIAAERERQESIEETERTGTDAYRALQTQIDTGVRKTKELIAAEQTLDQKFTQLKVSIKAAFKAGKIGPEEAKKAMQALNAEQKKARAAANNIGAANKSAFGSSAISSVKSYAASFVTVTAAIGVVSKALQFFNEEKERALGATDELVDTRRALRQVSKGDFDQLEAKADSLATDKDLGITREEARQLVFDARSTGFEGEERTVAAADPVISVTDGASFAGEFRKFFSQDNLSIEQAFNTALAGAAESQANISQLLPQVRTSAQGALAGGESSDVVAAASVLFSDFGKSTGDRLRALGTKTATNDQTKGLNLIDAVKKLQADPKLRDDIIKDSSELKAVFAKFTDRLGEIQAADRRIETEQRRTGSSGLIQKAINEANTSDVEVSRRVKVAAEQRRRIEEEVAFSAGAARGKAAQNDAVSDSLQRGDNGIQRFAAATTSEAARFASVDPATVRVSGLVAANIAGNPLGVAAAATPNEALAVAPAGVGAILSGFKALNASRKQDAKEQTALLRKLTNRPQLQGVD